MSRTLPRWIADGPEVSDLAYRIVEHAMTATRDGDVGEDVLGATLVEVVEHLAAELDVDEAEVLRAFDELGRAGVIEVAR